MRESKTSSVEVLAVVGTLASSDRRRSRRAKVSHPVRVRPSDPKNEHFEDVRCALNASRDGLYFATRRQSYHKEMRLFITFPYSSAATINCEYIGQVVRVDDLGDGRLGVAVQLLTTI